MRDRLEPVTGGGGRFTIAARVGSIALINSQLGRTTHYDVRSRGDG